MITVVDREEKSRSIMLVLDEIVDEGLVALSNLEIINTGAIDLAIGEFTAAIKRAPYLATAWMNFGAA